MYRMFKSGFLPNDGSYLAQPLGVLTAIKVIDQALDDCTKIKEENERSKQKRQGMKKTLQGKK